MYSLFVGAVGVGLCAAPLVGGDLVLVDDPFEGAAVAEAAPIEVAHDAPQVARVRIAKFAINCLLAP